MEETVEVINSTTVDLSIIEGKLDELIAIGDSIHVILHYALILTIVGLIVYCLYNILKSFII